VRSLGEPEGEDASVLQCPGGASPQLGVVLSNGPRPTPILPHVPVLKPIEPEDLGEFADAPVPASVRCAFAAGVHMVAKIRFAFTNSTKSALRKKKKTWPVPT